MGKDRSKVTRIEQQQMLQVQKKNNNSKIKSSSSLSISSKKKVVTKRQSPNVKHAFSSHNKSSNNNSNNTASSSIKKKRYSSPHYENDTDYIDTSTSNNNNNNNNNKETARAKVKVATTSTTEVVKKYSLRQRKQNVNYIETFIDDDADIDVNRRRERESKQKKQETNGANSSNNNERNNNNNNIKQNKKNTNNTTTGTMIDSFFYNDLITTKNDHRKNKKNIDYSNANTNTELIKKNSIKKEKKRKKLEEQKRLKQHAKQQAKIEQLATTTTTTTKNNQNNNGVNVQQQELQQQLQRFMEEKKNRMKNPNCLPWYYNVPLSLITTTPIQEDKQCIQKLKQQQQKHTTTGSTSTDNNNKKRKRSNSIDDSFNNSNSNNLKNNNTSSTNRKQSQKLPPWMTTKNNNTINIHDSTHSESKLEYDKCDNNNTYNASTGTTSTSTNECYYYTKTVNQLLDNELLLFSKYVQLSDVECTIRDTAIQQLDTIVQSIWGGYESSRCEHDPNNTNNPISLQIFGSYATHDVCTFTSDIDIAVWGIVPPSTSQLVQQYKSQKLIKEQQQQSTNKNSAMATKTKVLLSKSGHVTIVEQPIKVQQQQSKEASPSSLAKLQRVKKWSEALATIPIDDITNAEIESSTDNNNKTVVSSSSSSLSVIATSVYASEAVLLAATIAASTPQKSTTIQSVKRSDSGNGIDGIAEDDDHQQQQHDPFIIDCVGENDVVDDNNQNQISITLDNNNSTTSSAKDILTVKSNCNLELSRNRSIGNTIDRAIIVDDDGDDDNDVKHNESTIQKVVEGCDPKLVNKKGDNNNATKTKSDDTERADNVTATEIITKSDDNDDDDDDSADKMESFGNPKNTKLHLKQQIMTELAHEANNKNPTNERCVDITKQTATTVSTSTTTTTEEFSFRSHVLSRSNNTDININNQSKNDTKKTLQRTLSSLTTTTAFSTSSSSDDDNYDEYGDDNKVGHDTDDEDDDVFVNTTTTTSTSRNNNNNNNGTMYHFTATSFLTDRQRRDKITDTLAQLCQKIRKDRTLASTTTFIKNARVPIIKVLTTYGFEMDIAIGGCNGTDTSLFASKQVQFYKSFSPVVLFLKVLLYQKRLDVPFEGGLGSYKLYVLVAAHIEKHLELGGNDQPGEILLSFLYRYGCGSRHESLTKKQRQLDDYSDPDTVTILRQYMSVYTNNKSSSCSSSTDNNNWDTNINGAADLSNVYRIDAIVTAFRKSWESLVQQIHTVQQEQQQSMTATDDVYQCTSSLLDTIIDCDQLHISRQNCLNRKVGAQQQHQQQQQQHRTPPHHQYQNKNKSNNHFDRFNNNHKSKTTYNGVPYSFQKYSHNQQQNESSHRNSYSNFNNSNKYKPYKKSRMSW